MAKHTLLALVLLLCFVTEAFGAATGALEKPRIAIDNGLLSVALERAPAGEVFRAIAEKENLLIRLDESLFRVLLTDEFEKLPLEEGLKRLIGQLRTDNFLLGYVAEPGGSRRVVSAEILVRGGVVAEFGGQAAASAKRADPKGRRIQIERWLNPGQRKHVERTGKMPRSVTRIPEGTRLRMERGEDVGGWQWKVDRALQAQAAEASQSPVPEGPEGQSARGSEVPEKK